MNREQAFNGLYVCPCCGYATLSEPSCYEICELCFWEDDGQDDPQAGDFWGGPNHIALSEGRINFQNFGACDLKDRKHVREPNGADINVRKFILKNGTVVRSENT
jgi:hypothetical protein